MTSGTKKGLAPHVLVVARCDFEVCIEPLSEAVSPVVPAQLLVVGTVVEAFRVQSCFEGELARVFGVAFDGCVYLVQCVSTPQAVIGSRHTTFPIASLVACEFGICKERGTYFEFFVEVSDELHCVHVFAFGFAASAAGFTKAAEGDSLLESSANDMPHRECKAWLGGCKTERSRRNLGAPGGRDVGPGRDRWRLRHPEGEGLSRTERIPRVVTMPRVPKHRSVLRPPNHPKGVASARGVAGHLQGGPPEQQPAADAAFQRPQHERRKLLRYSTKNSKYVPRSLRHILQASRRRGGRGRVVLAITAGCASLDEVRAVSRSHRDRVGSPSEALSCPGASTTVSLDELGGRREDAWSQLRTR